MELYRPAEQFLLTFTLLQNAGRPLQKVNPPQQVTTWGVT
jgi:hypothetical protein